MEARTVGVTVGRPWQEVYAALWRPRDFSRWASGLSQSSLEQDGEAWKATGPEGAVRIHFTPHNPFGVMDHRVELPDGSVVQVPMRILPNGDGAEVILTLFRQPGMSDEKFAEDLAWVGRDLAALRALFH
jgi:hypothetical protein